MKIEILDLNNNVIVYLVFLNDKEWESFLKSLIPHILTSILHIRYALEREREGSLKAELQATHLIQEAFLPQHIEVSSFDISAFYRPTFLTGGDWYGYSFKKNEYAYFFIADITGHGVSSAMLTGLICGAIFASEHTRNMMEKEDDPKSHLLETMQTLNETILKTESRCQKFSTMLMVAVHVKTGKYFHINA